MRMSVAALAIGIAMMGPASAIEYRTPVTKQLFTCAKPGVSRVAVAAGPAACCEGQLRCAEYLATTDVKKSLRSRRT